MQISPLKEYKPPGFPESDKISVNKAELYKFVPERWKKAIAVTGTALSLLLGSPDAGNCREIIKPSGLGVKTATTGSLWSVGGRIAERYSDQPKMHAQNAGAVSFDGNIAGFNIRNFFNGLSLNRKSSSFEEAEAVNVCEFVRDEFAKNGIKFDKQNYNVNPGGSPLILDQYSTSDRFGYMVVTKENSDSIKNYCGKKADYIENAAEAFAFIEKDLLKTKKIKCIIFPRGENRVKFLVYRIRNCLRNYRVVSR
ncbi:MAG: hypothetical protein LWY06_07180 [Firmicutes bacterium]|nr:hypothetical protein [Bacillota bacterium]